MRNRVLIFALFVTVFASVNAQTQSGIVRTAVRPNQPSQRLQGAVVRVKGDYNPVMTEADGSFAVLMPGQKNGEPYTLAGVNKAGYELREPELIGRVLAFSEKVPVEIVMLSRKQLQADKQRIEQAARENIERYYEQRLTSLNDSLAAATISNKRYEELLAALEAQYERYEPLITQMAERYARTDYSKLNKEESDIQDAIEQGDLDRAQQLIMAKGTPEKREQKVQHLKRLAEEQKNELAQDYYYLYTIHLSRFANDSALYYLLRRAQLDTTNVQWQLDGGNFYDKMDQRFEEALVFYRRALRYAIANDGEHSTAAAQAHNNIAYALTRLMRYDEALPEQKTALHLYEEIYGLNHNLTAARMSNVGVIYYYLNRLDSASVYFQKANDVYATVDQANLPNVPVLRAELLNNIAAISMAQGRLDEAEDNLRKALTLLPEDKDNDRLTILQSLAAVLYSKGEKAEARTYFQQAYDIALRIFGAEHPTTKYLYGLTH